MRQQSPEAPVEVGQKNPNTRRSTKILTTVTGSSLGGIALAYMANRHVGIELPQDPEFLFSSIKHPAVGYLGALAASALGRRHGSNSQLRDGIIGATIANFAAEVGQSASSALMSPTEPDNFLSTDSSDMFETAKDYAFALAGAAILGVQNKMTQLTTHFKQS